MQSDLFSHIYMLVSNNNKQFKIGKADDLHNRIQTLENVWNKFDLNKSVQIKCKKNHVFKLEKTLHFIFDNWNLSLNEKYDGHTEWFDIACFDQAIQMINYIKDAKPNDVIEIVVGIQIPKIPKKSNYWNKLTKTEKKHYREEKKRKEIEEIKKLNIQHAYQFIELFSKLEKNIINIKYKSNVIVFKNNYEIYNILRQLHGKVSSFAGYHYYCGILSSLTIYEDDTKKIFVKFNCDCLQSLKKYDEAIEAIKILKNYFINNIDGFCLEKHTSQ